MKNTESKKLRWFVRLEFKNGTIHLHDGEEVVEWQGKKWTGIGKTLTRALKVKESLTGNQLRITLRLQDGWKQIARRRYMNRKLTISACLVGIGSVEEKRKWIGVIRSWKFNLCPIGITFEGTSQIEATVAKGYPCNWAEESNGKRDIPNPEAKWWIRIRRRFLNWIEAEEAHRRPQYWSHIDQQERYPRDTGFTHARRANSPRHRWRTEQQFIMQKAPGRTPATVWWAEVKYQIKNLIHPEWWWAMGTRNGRKILVKILKWSLGQA